MAVNHELPVQGTLFDAEGQPSQPVDLTQHPLYIGPEELVHDSHADRMADERAARDAHNDTVFERAAARGRQNTTTADATLPRELSDHEFDRMDRSPVTSNESLRRLDDMSTEEIRRLGMLASGRSVRR